MIDRRERPVCRSESPVSQSSTMIWAGFDIVPAEWHVGRSLRLNQGKRQITTETR